MMPIAMEPRAIEKTTWAVLIEGERYPAAFGSAQLGTDVPRRYRLVMTSIPRMYGRSTSGTFTVPSAWR